MRGSSQVDAIKRIAVKSQRGIRGVIARGPDGICDMRKGAVGWIVSTEFRRDRRAVEYATRADRQAAACSKCESGHSDLRRLARRRIDREERGLRARPNAIKMPRWVKGQIGHR